MVVRTFHLELKEVKRELLEMGYYVETVLKKLHDGFNETNNREVMGEIIRGDEKINQIELNLHDRVTLLISKQQPVATDLRVLIVVLKISSDLERVADLAVDMAKQTIRLKNSALIAQKKEQLSKMFQLAQLMIDESLQAVEHTDLLKAQKIATLDDEVDQMYGEFIRELFKLHEDQIEIDQITQLAFIGRYIERIADYATNIAEWVVYEVNGKHFDLN